MGKSHWKPDNYLERIRAEIPRYDELQEQAIAAVPSPPERVLELGMGTGETTRRLIEAYPDSWVIGLDASADMVFRARENYDDVQLARMEDPLPDGPWDLVIGVLSIHHLTSDQKKNLFRQVRTQARSFVIGDIVKAGTQIAPVDPEYDFPETAADLADWCGGEVAWEADDLAVIRAIY
jgi:tRNA (cmo5U34)-methyltransferase